MARPDPKPAFVLLTIVGGLAGGLFAAPAATIFGATLGALAGMVYLIMY